MAFKEAKRKGQKKTSIKMPDFEIEDIEDYYTFYVQILKISESVFWYSDFSFVRAVAENKSAYDDWYNAEISYAMEKER